MHRQTKPPFLSLSYIPLQFFSFNDDLADASDLNKNETNPNHIHPTAIVHPNAVLGQVLIAILFAPITTAAATTSPVFSDDFCWVKLWSIYHLFLTKVWVSYCLGCFHWPLLYCWIVGEAWKLLSTASRESCFWGHGIGGPLWITDVSLIMIIIYTFVLRLYLFVLIPCAYRWILLSFKLKGAVLYRWAAL